METNRTTIISKPGNKLPNYHSNILTELNRSKMKNHTNIINQDSYKPTGSDQYKYYSRMLKTNSPFESNLKNKPMINILTNPFFHMQMIG